MTGGGSGGHITPLLAVAHEIKQLQPDAKVLYIGQTGDNFGAIVAEHEVIDETYSVQAGKFRRYHGEGLKQVLDVHTLWLNVRDAFRVLLGLWQAWRLLGKLKPDVVFCKGGFVGVPVGLAAAARRIPYLTHDSDAIPGLANRIIGRWAAQHAVALPVEGYPYPAAKTVNVGVPVSHHYRPVDAELERQYRKQTGLDGYEPVLLVTGGGLGAEFINNAVLAAAPALLRDFPQLCIVHAAGHKHEQRLSTAYTQALTSEQRKRVIVRDYLNDLYKYSGAADVVIARGGATTFAEFAQQGVACVIIPNPILTGGHQIKNAKAYADSGAVVMVDEVALRKNPQLLEREVKQLLQHPAQREQLQVRIAEFARPDAAKDIAQLLIGLQKGGTDGVRQK